MRAIEEAQLYARLPVFRRRVLEAQRIIEAALTQCGAPYVSTSFGKDSAALMHLVRIYQPEIQCRFIRWPESNLLHDYDCVINEWVRRGANIHILDLARSSLNDSVADRWDQLRNLAPSDALFSGLRADESRARKITLQSHGAICRQKNGVLRVCPLAHWKTADVAAYCIQHGLPTLGDYLRYGYDARTTARVPRETYGIREATLQRLREDRPAQYAQLQTLYDLSAWI